MPIPKPPSFTPALDNASGGQSARSMKLVQGTEEALERFGGGLAEWRRVLSERVVPEGKEGANFEVEVGGGVGDEGGEETARSAVAHVEQEAPDVEAGDTVDVVAAAPVVEEKKKSDPLTSAAIKSLFKAKGSKPGGDVTCQVMLNRPRIMPRELSRPCVCLRFEPKESEVKMHRAFSLQTACHHS